MRLYATALFALEIIRKSKASEPTEFGWFAFR